MNNNAGDEVFDESVQSMSRPPVVLPNETQFTVTVNGRNLWMMTDIYELQEGIGSGNFGTVYRAKHKYATQVNDRSNSTVLWKDVAIKRSKPNDLDRRDKGRFSHDKIFLTYGDLEKFCQEIKTLKLLQRNGAHAMTTNHLFMYEIFWDGSQFYLVSELLEQDIGQWRDNCDVFTERMAIEMCRTILEALQYIHSQSVVHRDLKLQNVMFKEVGNPKSLKIVDFGLARVLAPDESTNEFCGSLGYISPEQYNGESYRCEVDMFAFGALMFRLLSNTRPFSNANSRVLRQHTRELKYNVNGEDWNSVSPAAKDMIRQMLINKQERLDADQALRHRWFREAGQTILKVDHTFTHGPDEKNESEAFVLVRNEICLFTIYSFIDLNSKFSNILTPICFVRILFSIIISRTCPVNRCQQAQTVGSGSIHRYR